MSVLDAHHHLWDLKALGLNEMPGPLNRNFLPRDLAPELQTAGVDYTILVGGFPMDTLHNRWFLEQAAATEWIAGVVGWVDLKQPATVGPDLDALKQEAKFVGIRHLIELETDVNWMIQPPVLEGFREMASRDVLYEMLVKTVHLDNVLDIIERVPELRLVIDHIAKPDIAHGGSPGWAEKLRDIASTPGIYCKLSGMVTEAAPTHWQAEDLRPYAEQVIQFFGTDRVMYGSDWPVCLNAASYQQVWNAANTITSNLTPFERDQVFGDNAVRCYHLAL